MGITSVCTFHAFRPSAGSRRVAGSGSRFRDTPLGVVGRRIINSDPPLQLFTLGPSRLTPGLISNARRLGLYIPILLQPRLRTHGPTLDSYPLTRPFALLRLLLANAKDVPQRRCFVRPLQPAQKPPSRARGRSTLSTPPARVLRQSGWSLARPLPSVLDVRAVVVIRGRLGGTG